MKKVFEGIIVVLLTIFILSWPTMWLWNNCLVGAIDGINPIGFLQTLGITFLFNALVKSNPKN
tara:strand:- start:43 stop:231 length:189 start_codon:yes stop_codon:yes gene_type:complete